MFEGDERDQGVSEGEPAGGIGGQGGEGDEQARTTPPIGDEDQVGGQTQAPAPADDAGSSDG
jgi:hypothetical protein